MSKQDNDDVSKHPKIIQLFPNKGDKSLQSKNQEEDIDQTKVDYLQSFSKYTTDELSNITNIAAVIKLNGGRTVYFTGILDDTSDELIGSIERLKFLIVSGTSTEDDFEEPLS